MKGRCIGRLQLANYIPRLMESPFEDALEENVSLTVEERHAAIDKELQENPHWAGIKELPDDMAERVQKMFHDKHLVFLLEPLEYGHFQGATHKIELTNTKPFKERVGELVTTRSRSSVTILRPCMPVRSYIHLNPPGTTPW